MTEAYFAHLPLEVSRIQINRAFKERIVYSAMHGVGTEFIKRAFEACHFAPEVLTLVPEQCSKLYNEIS